MKAFSQNDTIGKGSSSTQNGGVPKTILTKTQSEPRTNVTFEVNSQPLISQVSNNLLCFTDQCS